MNRLIATTSKVITVAFGTILVTAVSLVPNAQPAWAPPMMAFELAELRANGWQPCEPVISQLPAEALGAGLVADADNGEQSGTCAVRFAADIPADALHWVAWHEACHLATIADIHADPAREQFKDWAHEHPLFIACIDQGPAERGGY